MARIVIDARKYFDFGIGTYISHLIEGLAAIQSSHTYCLLVSPGDAGKIIAPPGWQLDTVAYGKYSVSEFLLLGRRVRSYGGTSVFHSPHYTLPLGLTGRSIVTIHDLIHLRFPELFSAVQRTYARGMIGHAVKSARFVVTDSEFTRQDILKSFRASEEKVVTIPLGVSDRFKVLSDAERRQFRTDHRLTNPYFLFVGNPKPHKGVDILLRAFESLASSYSDHELVFLGGRPPDEVLNRTGGGRPELSRRIRIVGRVSDEELVGFYNCADMLVLPSRYEGFGLPVLEAMACGTCTVVSDAASLPEVAGDAALIFQSGNHVSLAGCLESLLRDPVLRETMIDRGKRRVREFSWERTANETFRLYERVLSE